MARSPRLPRPPRRAHRSGRSPVARRNSGEADSLFDEVLGTAIRAPGQLVMGDEIKQGAALAGDCEVPAASVYIPVSAALIRYMQKAEKMNQPLEGFSPMLAAVREPAYKAAQMFNPSPLSWQQGGYPRVRLSPEQVEAVKSCVTVDAPAGTPVYLLPVGNAFNRLAYIARNPALTSPYGISSLVLRDSAEGAGEGRWGSLFILPRDYMLSVSKKGEDVDLKLAFGSGEFAEQLSFRLVDALKDKHPMWRSLPSTERNSSVEEAERGLARRVGSEALRLAKSITRIGDATRPEVQQEYDKLISNCLVRFVDEAALIGECYLDPDVADPQFPVLPSVWEQQIQNSVSRVIMEQARMKDEGAYISRKDMQERVAQAIDRYGIRDFQTLREFVKKAKLDEDVRDAELASIEHAEEGSRFAVVKETLRGAEPKEAKEFLRSLTGKLTASPYMPTMVKVPEGSLVSNVAYAALGITPDGLDAEGAEAYLPEYTLGGSTSWAGAVAQLKAVAEADAERRKAVIAAIRSGADDPDKAEKKLQLFPLMLAVAFVTKKPIPELGKGLPLSVLGTDTRRLYVGLNPEGNTIQPYPQASPSVLAPLAAYLFNLRAEDGQRGKVTLSTEPPTPLFWAALPKNARVKQLQEVARENPGPPAAEGGESLFEQELPRKIEGKRKSSRPKKREPLALGGEGAVIKYLQDMLFAPPGRKDEELERRGTRAELIGQATARRTPGGAAAYTSGRQAGAVATRVLKYPPPGAPPAWEHVLLRIMQDDGLKMHGIPDLIQSEATTSRLIETAMRLYGIKTDGLSQKDQLLALRAAVSRDTGGQLSSREIGDYLPAQRLRRGNVLGDEEALIARLNPSDEYAQWMAENFVKDANDTPRGVGEVEYEQVHAAFPVKGLQADSAQVAAEGARIGKFGGFVTKGSRASVEDYDFGKEAELANQKGLSLTEARALARRRLEAYGRRKRTTIPASSALCATNRSQKLRYRVPSALMAAGEPGFESKKVVLWLSPAGTGNARVMMLRRNAHIDCDFVAMPGGKDLGQLVSLALQDVLMWLGQRENRLRDTYVYLGRIGSGALKLAWKPGMKLRYESMLTQLGKDESIDIPGYNSDADLTNYARALRGTPQPVKTQEAKVGDLSTVVSRAPALELSEPAEPEGDGGSEMGFGTIF